jgi:hypothetical protein
VKSGLYVKEESACSTGHTNQIACSCNGGAFVCFNPPFFSPPGFSARLLGTRGFG